jgi:hypothetical protein
MGQEDEYRREFKIHNVSLERLLFLTSFRLPILHLLNLTCLINSRGYSFNPGTLTRPDVNLKEALKARNDVDVVVKKLDEVNLLLNREMSEQERKDRGFEAAYSLTTWGDYPGAFTLTGVLLQNISGGLIGSGGGKDSKLYNLAQHLRKHFANEVNA